MNYLEDEDLSIWLRNWPLMPGAHLFELEKNIIEKQCAQNHQESLLMSRIGNKYIKPLIFGIVGKQSNKLPNWVVGGSVVLNDQVSVNLLSCLEHVLGCHSLLSQFSYHHSTTSTPSQQYFAKPGYIEWPCWLY